MTTDIKNYKPIILIKLFLNVKTITIIFLITI